MVLFGASREWPWSWREGTGHFLWTVDASHHPLVHDDHIGRARHGNRTTGDEWKDETKAITHRNFDGAAWSVRCSRLCANSRGAKLRSARCACAGIREPTSS